MLERHESGRDVELWLYVAQEEEEKGDGAQEYIELMIPARCYTLHQDVRSPIDQASLTHFTLSSELSPDDSSLTRSLLALM